MKFETWITTCHERQPVLADSLRSLAATGWPAPQILVDDTPLGLPTSVQRIQKNYRRLIEGVAASTADFLLLCEDDAIYGRWFAENLRSWPLLRASHNGHFFGSLYNGTARENDRVVISRGHRYIAVEPLSAWGALALVMTPKTARFFADHWDQVEGNPDVKMPLLAARVAPVFFHVPSLVDHAQVPTTWFGSVNRAFDFEPEWRASEKGE